MKYLKVTTLFNVDLIYASSSSVYGEKKPMVENNRVKPIQFYAATKKYASLAIAVPREV